MVRILHVISRPTHGDGITEVVKNLALSIDRERFEISVCSLQGQGNAASDLEEMGIRVFSLNARSSSLPLYFPRNVYAVWQLMRLFRKERFGIVHAHEFFSGTLGRIAAWLARTPVIIVSLHNTDLWKQRPHILIDRCLARMTDKIITNSEAVKQFTAEYERIAPEKFAVIHNGIDLSRFSSEGNGDRFREEYDIKPREMVVGTVGRLVEQKGQHYFIEAARTICAQRKDVKFIVVGGDDCDQKESVRDELYKQVEESNLGDVVMFAGYRDDIPQVMGAFTVFVLPSLWEGFGLVVAEAMAAGRPVVASRLPAVSEVVQHGETGILVPPKDADALAKAILELLDSPGKAEAMGKAGRRRVERLFSSQAMAKKYEALYESLCSGGDGVAWGAEDSSNAVSGRTSDE
jgi:glycosyltransferase involved in cell wall biosynthesis